VRASLVRIIARVFSLARCFPTLLISQTTQTGQAPGPYARIAIMRALDGHSVIGRPGTSAS